MWLTDIDFRKKITIGILPLKLLYMPTHLEFPQYLQGSHILTHAVRRETGMYTYRLCQNYEGHVLKIVKEILTKSVSRVII